MSATPHKSVNPSEQQSGPWPDPEWIERIRIGDVAAFEALVLHYTTRLGAYVYRCIGDRDITQEVVQDLFLWIWRNRHEWEIRGSLATYLYRSARNRALSYSRRQRLERRW